MLGPLDIKTAMLETIDLIILRLHLLFDLNVVHKKFICYANPLG